MHGAVTVYMNAPAREIWDLVADVRNTGRFSPETFDAEWLDGATGPALGARFRGHVKRNEIGPVYWTTCRVTACEPGKEFGFAVLVGDRAVNNWHYRFVPSWDGTDVTESFRTIESAALRPFEFLGFLRKRRNLRDMRTTLERVKKVVEARRGAVWRAVHMGADTMVLNPSQRARLELHGAGLVLGTGYFPEAIVRMAAALVAEGVDSDGLVQLACLSTDVRLIDGYEVTDLLIAAFAELGLALPSEEAAGWMQARSLASAMIDGVIPPGEGAGRLWGFSGECGRNGELVAMLQLHEAWERAVGAERTAVEAKMLDCAAMVVAEANRYLDAYAVGRQKP